MATVRKTSLKNRAAANTIVAATGNSSSKQPKESVSWELMKSTGIQNVHFGVEIHELKVSFTKRNLFYVQCFTFLKKVGGQNIRQGGADKHYNNISLGRKEAHTSHSSQLSLLYSQVTLLQLLIIEYLLTYIKCIYQQARSQGLTYYY